MGLSAIRYPLQFFDQGGGGRGEGGGGGRHVLPCCPCCPGARFAFAAAAAAAAGGVSTRNILLHGLTMWHRCNASSACRASSRGILKQQNFNACSQSEKAFMCVYVRGCSCRVSYCQSSSSRSALGPVSVTRSFGLFTTVLKARGNCVMLHVPCPQKGAGCGGGEGLAVGHRGEKEGKMRSEIHLAVRIDDSILVNHGFSMFSIECVLGNFDHIGLFCLYSRSISSCYRSLLQKKAPDVLPQFPAWRRSRGSLVVLTH